MTDDEDFDGAEPDETSPDETPAPRSFRPTHGRGAPLADTIVEQVEAILLDAEQTRRPIEIDPSRGRLFELFVTADAAGFLADDADTDLTADGLCRSLGLRWGLADATRESVSRQEKLPPEHVAKMRLLWSVLRMWMEWQYAWERWPEFHDR